MSSISFLKEEVTFCLLPLIPPLVSSLFFTQNPCSLYILFQSIICYKFVSAYWRQFIPEMYHFSDPCFCPVFSIWDEQMTYRDSVCCPWTFRSHILVHNLACNTDLVNFFSTFKKDDPLSLPS